jgi:hypothetical protein
MKLESSRRCIEAYNLFLAGGLSTRQIADVLEIGEPVALARVTVGRCIINNLPMPYRAVTCQLVGFGDSVGGRAVSGGPARDT